MNIRAESLAMNRIMKLLKDMESAQARVRVLRYCLAAAEENVDSARAYEPDGSQESEIADPLVSD